LHTVHLLRFDWSTGDKVFYVATSENVVYKLKLVTWALESVFVGSELEESCVSLPEEVLEL